MVVVDDSSYTGGLTAQVRWLGLRVGVRFVLFYIDHMNWVNSHNDLLVMMTYKYCPGYSLSLSVLTAIFQVNLG